MYYGSPFYILSLLILLGLGVGLWLILRRRSERVCRSVILALMLLNLFQHFFKAWIYPQHFGEGFTSVSTAYNMCATLIILSPLALLFKNRFLKNFVFFVGSVAGISAIAFPQWFIGWEVSQLGWKYFRFYLCHALLFLSSALPLALGLHRPRVREFWHTGTAFLLALCVIVINDFLCMALGIYPGASVENFYQSMLEINPCGIMGPPTGLPWLASVVGVFSPSVFIGNNPSGIYIPILWYAIPLFLGMSIGSAVLFSFWDRDFWKRNITPKKNHPTAQ